MSRFYTKSPTFGRILSRFLLQVGWWVCRNTHKQSYCTLHMCIANNKTTPTFFTKKGPTGSEKQAVINLMWSHLEPCNAYQALVLVL